MAKQIQKRSLVTRMKLIDAANEIISTTSYSDMRVEEVVRRAGVAKGTFFSHFRDKDALLDLIIGEKIDQFLDEIETAPPPENLDDFIRQILPLMDFMTSERYVFDVILRHSGAAAKEEIGPIAKTFERMVIVLADWISQGPFRKDISHYLLAEGVQAFATQAMALHFCAIHNEHHMHDRLKTYLQAWLTPSLN